MSLFHRTQQQSTDTMDNGAKLITVAHPKSPISEQFRTIRTNINFMAIDKPIKTLAMTSANVSEGKSTVTDNVAVVWAQTGQKVLLNSQRMKTLVDTVKGIYDMVIVDVPPMLEVTDTQILSRHLDAVVLVVKQGQTQKLAVKRAVELLNLAHANLLGYVMNDVNAEGDAAYGYGYGYGEDTGK